MTKYNNSNCNLNIQDIGQQILIINEIHMYNLSIIRQTKMKPYKEQDGLMYYSSVEWNNRKSGKRNNREYELSNKMDNLIKKFNNFKKKCKKYTKYTKYITSANKFLKVAELGPAKGSWADSEDNYNHFLTCIFDGGYKFITELLNGKHPGVNPNKLIKNESVSKLLTMIRDRHPKDLDIEKWEELSRGIKTTRFNSSFSKLKKKSRKSSIKNSDGKKSSKNKINYRF
jgi:hypothetical protein